MPMRLVNSKITKTAPSSNQASSFRSYSAALAEPITSVQDEDLEFPAVEEADGAVQSSECNSAKLSENTKPPEINPTQMPLAVQRIFWHSSNIPRKYGSATRSANRNKELKQLTTWMDEPSSSATALGLPSSSRQVAQPQTSGLQSNFTSPTPELIRRIQRAAEAAVGSGTLLSTLASAWDLTEFHANAPKIETFKASMVINFTMKVLCDDPRAKVGDRGIVPTEQGVMLFKQRFGIILTMHENGFTVVPLYTHRGSGISHLHRSEWHKYAAIGLKGRDPPFDTYAPGPRLLLDENASFDIKGSSYARLNQRHTIDFDQKTPLDGYEAVVGCLSKESFEELKRRCAEV
ncbi:hypothetical protein BU16DRAFT_539756 [Lophium mytilinum]|uniref:Uncharacterized protein n=1 Tax=Lophium mytilinum TaxID=390894 RepID=A0A6A6QQM6_9PEZI|nr:hypothetical protein BU16DRAFT_539756 [Lophium mytilinum]